MRPTPVAIAVVVARRLPRAPLLTDDLVIAARDRAREPELPEATLVRALSTPIVPRLARYDVIIVSDSSDDERETRIAAEFARHEHRVFHLGEHSARRPPAAPTLHRIAAPPASRADRPGLLDTLASLRQSEAIETAVLFAPASARRRNSRERRAVAGDGASSASTDAPVALSEQVDVWISFDADVKRHAT